MPKRIAKSTLQASTLDILNVIRANASLEYQSAVPVVTQASEIPKVGEIICGNPSFSNQFINALVNRIATYRLQSATFNNPYNVLKKGYIEFGETIEDIFTGLVNVIDYSAEKGEEREFKRTLPDVHSVFHTMNWRTMYPLTIQDEDLPLAFLSEGGVTELIAKMVEQIYTSAEYDEFLLFKYLLIKAISKGKMRPISIGNGTDLHEAAVQFRGTSNALQFMSKQNNEFGVMTTTPKSRQCIFMDATFNAQFDVNVLASAFNMDKADFMGRLFLIDDWTSFDNDRFEIIRANSDGIEEVKAEELALLADVKAVLIDSEWFQVYDNKNRMTEKYVASGLYWNYFYHVWKTISYSPFANALVFVTSGATITLPNTITVNVDSVSRSDEAAVCTLSVGDNTSLQPSNVTFVQTEQCTKDGIAVQKYGALLASTSNATKNVTLVATINGTTYTATTNIKLSTVAVGATITLNKEGYTGQ